MKKQYLTRFIVIFFLITISAIYLVSKGDILNVKNLHDTDLYNQTIPPKFHNPKIEYELYKLIEEATIQKKAPGWSFGLQRNPITVEDPIQIIIESKSVFSARQLYAGANIAKNMVLALGGRVETTFKDLVQCRLPVSTIEELSLNDFVRYIRLPFKPQALEMISEGVNKTGANSWQNLTLYRSDGESPKIAILDIGFKGYQSLLGNELPSDVNTKSFRADGDIFANQVHGTACAEIVHDMSPNANLWLVNFATDVEQHKAVDWLISQGIQIISYSIGWENSGAGNGTGPICEDVEKAKSQGIFWVGAAGNEAEKHWEGTYSDPDNDRWHNFGSVDEILDFWVPAYTDVSVFLNWDDWGSWNLGNYSGSRQDYDLYLYIWSNNLWYLVDSSLDWQEGSQWPTEYIGSWYATKATYWGVAIRKFNATRNVKLELFTKGNSAPIEYNVPEGSLTIPADSASSITVGATDWSSDTYHSYSSRGPTHDGRVKPDISAPSGVSTVSYGTTNFYGTSAATPHVAGALGTIREKVAYSYDQIYYMLQIRAVDLGQAGKDNQYGVGRLSLNKK